MKAPAVPSFTPAAGIISAEASADLLEFAERSQIPVATTLMGIGAMPETHPLSLRWLGMHGAVFANNAVNEADLVIALGARFDDRVTGAVNMFCPDSTIVHIDIDASEINKNKKVAPPHPREREGRPPGSQRRSGRLKAGNANPPALPALRNGSE